MSGDLPDFVFLGYCAKHSLRNIASVSDCLSKRPDKWVERWDFNRATFWGSEAAAWASEHPGGYELLRWGKRVSGLRVTLGEAPDDQVRELLEESWRRRAPKRLAAERDRTRPGG